MYYLHGKFTAKEGKRDELSQILLEAADLVGAIDGCHLYVVGVDANDKNGVFVTEIWKSQEVQKLSLQDETVRGLIGKAVPLIESISDEDRVELELVGGHGIEMGA